MEEVIVDGKDHILGRLASAVAKELLKGKKVTIYNSENVLISGNPKHINQRFAEKLDRGDPYAGPFFPKRPDMIVKRVVRGMLPKKARGREALKRLRVHIGMPEGVEPNFLTERKELESKTTKLGDISAGLGAKKMW